MVRTTKPKEEVRPVQTPGVLGQASAMHEAAKLPDYSWAINTVKLNRAKAYVNQTQAGLKGKDLENAVKDRYVEIKGLLVEEAPSRLPKGKVRGASRNMSENDGSAD